MEIAHLKRQKVKSLYSQALQKTYSELIRLARRRPPLAADEWATVRQYLSANTTITLKNDLIDYLIFKDGNRMPVILQMVFALIDERSKILKVTNGKSSFNANQYHSLVSHLLAVKCVGLERFLANVVVYPTNNDCRDVMVRSNVLLHSLLFNGLGKNLTVLVLKGGCDDKTLQVIGIHCVKLVTLDVSRSWLVTDRGIWNLCNGPAPVTLCACKAIYNLPDNVQPCICGHYSLQRYVPNRCCETLTCVRIQDTNTTNDGVWILLSMIRNLKSVGGFMFMKSIVQTLMSAQKNGYQLSGPLELRELCDKYATSEQISVLSELMPKLTCMYTTAKGLPTLKRYFPKLNTAIIDFNHELAPPSYSKFYYEHGVNLTTLLLVDQAQLLDVQLVAKVCPNLRRLYARIGLSNTNVARCSMKHLVLAHVTSPQYEAFSWLTQNAPHLLDLSVTAIYDTAHIFTPSDFEDSFIGTLLLNKPKCLSKLESLKLQATEKIKLSREYILKLLEVCPTLKVIGDANGWEQGAQIVRYFSSVIVEHNLVVRFCLKKVIHPPMDKPFFRERVNSEPICSLFDEVIGAA